jgi:arylsulfatase A-like enzyme
MRSLSRRAALLLGILAGCAAPVRERPVVPRGILLILADDLGYSDLGCFGGTIAETPRLDRLAAEGVRFSQFYVASPICSPSRVALTTGMFPARWRINSYLHDRKGNAHDEQADWLDPKAPSLARTLREAGYATGHFGKWHLGGGRDVNDAPLPKEYGFDESFVSSLPLEGMGPALDPKTPRWKSTGVFVDRTLDFIRRHKDRPFYVNLWTADVHDPHVPEMRVKDGLENFRAVLAEFDRQMGRLLDGLRELGVDESTLVLFTGDNGPNPPFHPSRTGGLRGQKWSLYEGGLREPFLARWKGTVPAGRVDETTVLAAVDLFPSLVALAGVRPPDGAAFDGEDLSGALLGRRVNRTRPLFWEYGRKPGYLYPKAEIDRSPNVAVRDGRWKLLVNADGSGAELYDLTADPRETRNLAGDAPEAARSLRSDALAWRATLP